MKRIAIVHPEIGLGGPDTVSVWILETLKSLYDTELIACKEVDFNKLDEVYGTSLSNNNNIKVKIVKIPSIIKNSSKGRLLKQHILMRFCKANASKYDLMFSTYNEMDFGRRGIQYIHFPNMDIIQSAKHNLIIDRWYYRASFVRNAYLELAKMISNYKKINIINNLTLVNSNWTGKIFNEIYGCKTTTLYPPILDDFKDINWDSRNNDFIFIGIISPDKMIPEIISILKKVRENGFNINFHIIGRIRGEDADHVKRFYELLKDNKEWIFYDGVISRKKMLDIISKNRYGIHAKQEHFGISIAELIKGGCITFVANEGGHLEIIGEMSGHLSFGSQEEAVNKIISILKDKDLQNTIRNNLSKNINKFSLKNFQRNLISIIENFLKMNGS